MQSKKNTVGATKPSQPKPRTGQSLPGFSKTEIDSKSTATVKGHIPDSKHTHPEAKKHLGSK